MTSYNVEQVMEEKRISSEAELIAALGRISFKPSCIDMGWNWRIQAVHEADPRPHWSEMVLKGWLLQCSFQRPDTVTGKIETGYGRQEFLVLSATESAVVKTAWVCIQMTVHHELMESFCFDGKRLFDPHKTVEQLTADPRP